MTAAASPTVTVQIDKIVAGGDGLARMADGRVAFVTGALPGERVAIRIDDERRDFVRGSVVDVIDPSAARRPPPCPMVAAGCGGCGWQHITPPAQLAIKTDIVTDALTRTARLPSATVRVGGAVPAEGYRTTMRLASTPGGLGLRAAGSHRIVPLAACPVAHPALSEMLGQVRVAGATEVTLRVSASTGERTALADGGAGARWTGLGEARQGEQAALVERVAGHDLRVSAPSFFQSGPAAAELLVDAVRRAAGDLAAATTVDAYGGIGLFAATVSCGRVTVVESSPSACADARANLAGREATVIRATVERWTPTAAPLVVADPARRGLGRDGVEALTAASPDRLVLVSCDPVAMARDTALLGAAGYAHQVSEVFDLFPNTHHVEVVSTFVRVGNAIERGQEVARREPTARRAARSTRSRNAARRSGETRSMP